MTSFAALAIAAAAPLAADILCETARPVGGPEGLSGVTRVAGDRYLCAEDRGGRLHDATIRIAGGRVSFTTNRVTCLAGRTDMEGCAYDPLTKNVWVSDESDSSIRAFDLSTGKEVAALEIPEIYRKNIKKHRSFESLAISPDGLRLYTANEEALRGDATNVVRIQEFSRKGAASPFRPSRRFDYQVDPPAGTPFGRRTFSGVSALVAMPDGSLLVLEREFSVKLLPSFRIRIYRIVPGTEGKTLVWEAPATFSNYEGMCRRKRLRIMV